MLKPEVLFYVDSDRFTNNGGCDMGELKKKYGFVSGLKDLACPHSYFGGKPPFFVSLELQ